MKFLEELKYWWGTTSSGLLPLIKDIRDLDFADLLEGEYKAQWQSKRLAPVFQKNQRGNSNCSFQMWSNILAVYFGENVSARYLTAKAWQLGLCQKGGGANLRTGAKIAQKYGVVWEKDCPSDETLPWEVYVNVNFSDLDKLAEQNKIGSYYSITKTHHIYEAIDKGYAVAIGRTWFTSMDMSNGFSAPWIIKRTGLSISGHATCCLGYSFLNSIEINSYGSYWGDAGFFYASMSDIQKDIDTYGCFAISSVPYSPKELKINYLKNLINTLLAKLKEMIKKPTWLELVNGELGNDFTDDTRVPDSVSCAYALTTLLNRYDKRIPIIMGTHELNDFMVMHTELFERMPDPVIIKAGDLVISPTGTGKLKNGHCGVYISETQIVSNDSETGLWSKNWTRQTWKDYFSIYGEMPIRIFRLKI